MAQMKKTRKGGAGGEAGERERAGEGKGKRRSVGGSFDLFDASSYTLGEARACRHPQRQSSPVRAQNANPPEEALPI